jgi:hypothetical protein
MLRKSLCFMALAVVGLLAQIPPPPPDRLDQIVARIALYPDPLLAQVLTASTYWNEIPEAAAWADQHRYLSGDQVAAAINEDRLPWHPSVLALLPLPDVLDMMARDMGWTEELGNAVLRERAYVMDAVQRERQRALDYGYLRNGPEYRVVVEPGNIEILPADPVYVYVPYYDPAIVFYRPRPGLYMGGAIRFGPRIFVGGGFAPYGWASPGFGWRSHDIIIDRRPWQRTWENRERYEHPYAVPPRRWEGPREEHHERREQREERREHR